MSTVGIADGLSLKERYVRSERRKRLQAFLLVAPLMVFILVTFIAPVGEMFFRSVDNTTVHETLIETGKALESWDPEKERLPPDSAYTALLADVRRGAESKAITRIGQRLNYQIAGVSSIFRKTARRVAELPEETPDAKAALIGIHLKWGEPDIWRGIKFFSSPYTGNYYLDAADFYYSPEENQYLRRDEDQRVYFKLFVRTLLISAFITLLTLLMGYPTAFLLASMPSRKANILLVLVLLPFWTSLLVRTTAWIVLLYQEGVINDILVWGGLVDDGDRPELIHNKTGTVVAMTHILLPFMILPLYSVMKTISPSYMRAARSLGANSFVAFVRVYFPQTVPGIGAGAILVFILAIGYYITPELVGGAEGTFISNRIAYHIRSSGNWGLASALGLILLLLVLGMYWCYDKIVGVDNVKLG